MANNYQLNITKLEVNKTEGDLTDVVFLVHFSYVATTEDEQYSETALGMASVASPDPESFTNFSELTEEQVKSWVENKVNFESYRNHLDTRIQEKINPPTEAKDVPW